MSAASAPFFDMESRLVERLESIAPNGVRVMTAAALSGLAETAQHVPAWNVIYGGYREVDEQAAGAVQLVEQRWFVITATRNAASQVTGREGRLQAGQLMNLALHALLGWPPGAPFTRLRLGTGGAPVFRPGGYAYHPLLFTTRLTLTGEALTARGYT